MTTLCQGSDSAPYIAENHVFRCDGVAGIIGGAAADQAILAEVAGYVTAWVAADGGADRAMATDIAVDAVIGDMDSISDAARQQYADRLHPVTEQMTTDFDKALRHVDAPLVLAVGVSGGRLDHSLAALTVLARLPARPCIIVGGTSVVALCPPKLHIDLSAGAEVSIYPLAPLSVASEGLEWPTDGLELSPVDLVSTSNHATGPVTLIPDAPTALVILDRADLPRLIDALLAAPRWVSNSEC